MDKTVYESLAQVIATGQIAAAIAVLSGVFVAVGQGTIVSKAIESIARQPEARGSVTSTMFIGLGMCETGGIYGLLIAMILLFANPLVGVFTKLVVLG